MVTLPKRSLVAICVACLIAGAVLSNSPILAPANERPVLKAIAKFARTALWFMAFAEPPPDENDRSHEIQSVIVDENGYAHLNHARGW